MKSFGGFRIAVYLEFLLPPFMNLVGAALVESAALSSFTMLGFSYVKSFEFSFRSFWALFEYSRVEIFQSCGFKFHL